MSTTGKTGQEKKLEHLDDGVLRNLIAQDHGNTVPQGMRVDLDDDFGGDSASEGVISRDGPTLEKLVENPDSIKKEEPEIEKQLEGEGDNGAETSSGKDDLLEVLRDEQKEQEQDTEEQNAEPKTDAPKTDELVSAEPNQMPETSPGSGSMVAPQSGLQQQKEQNPPTEQNQPDTLPADEQLVQEEVQPEKSAEEVEEELRQSYGRNQAANEESKLNATWLGKIGYVAKGIGLTIRHGFRSLFSRFGKTRKAWLNPSVDKKTGKKGKSGKQLSWEGVKDYWKTGARNIAASEAYYNKKSLLLGNGPLLNEGHIEQSGSVIAGGGLTGVVGTGISTVKNLLTGNFRAFGQSLKETIKAPFGFISRLLTTGARAIKNVVTGKIFTRPAETLGGLYSDMKGVLFGAGSEAIRYDFSELTPEQKKELKRKKAQQQAREQEEEEGGAPKSTSVQTMDYIVTESKPMHEAGTIVDKDTFGYNFQRGKVEAAQARRGSLFMLLLYPNGSDYRSMSTWWGHVKDDFRKSWLGRVLGLNDEMQQLAIMDADEDRQQHYYQSCAIVDLYMKKDGDVTKEQYTQALKLKKLYESHYDYSWDDSVETDAESESEFEDEDQEFLFDAKTEREEAKKIVDMSELDAQEEYKRVCRTLKQASEKGDSLTPEELRKARRLKWLLEMYRFKSSKDFVLIE